MVVPIYDDNPFTQPIKPVVTWCLIAANLIVYFFEAGSSEAGLDRVLEVFSLIPAVFIGDIDALGWRRSSPTSSSTPTSATSSAT
jgi:membrane associated rhomboid family serine protease